MEIYFLYEKKKKKKKEEERNIHRALSAKATKHY